MAKALTNIVHGGKSHREPSGSYIEDEPMKTIRPGDTVNKKDFSDAEWKDLVAARAVSEDDDDATVHPTPQSTAAILQSPESVSETNIPPTVVAEAAPLTEEQIAEEHKRNTDQVARGDNAATTAKEKAK